MHTNRKSVVIWNGEFCFSWAKNEWQKRKIKHCDKRYPMHWHNFEFMCDNFSINCINCSLQHNGKFWRKKNTRWNTQCFMLFVCKLNCTQNHGNKSSRRITAGWTNATSMALIANLLWNEKQTFFSSVKCATSVSLSMEIVALKATNFI